MRICLVTHGFPPNECTGVENYTAALAGALTEAGHQVEVFTPRVARELPDLSLRRERRAGYRITWITTNTPPKNPEEMLELPGVKVRFRDFLDREMPEIIHFQHLIKLGLGLVEVASEFRIPTVYTAHDYYAVCHRVTLIRPDLSRCEIVGDPERCARCDLGLSFLNQRSELGDYQLGAFADQLGADNASKLAEVLTGEPQAAGFPVDEIGELTRKRTVLDTRRLEAYRRFDLVLSPTQFLADKLSEGGLDRDRIRILTYGAETEDLDSLERIEYPADRPIHFGFLGGLTKQKGVHVLLEAFGLLEAEARLSIWGSSTDAVYVDALEEDALAAGAELRGEFDRDQLRAALEEVDVVVVPSIWVENFPFVIREAFAAKRPVLTSDVGALPESVRHGVDGLLVPPGDAKALALAMARLIEERDLLGKLSAGIEEVKGIAEQAQELVKIYADLQSERAPRDDSQLPASLKPWQQRFDALSAMPQRHLFRTVLTRLGKIEVVLSGEESASSNPVLTGEALALESKTQTLLRDLRREKDWLRRSVASQQASRDALREHLQWREDTLQQSELESNWLRDSLQDHRKTTEHLEKENGWLRDVNAQTKAENESLRKEVEWLRGIDSEKSLGEEQLRKEQSELAAEVTWLREIVGNRDEELAWLRRVKRDAERDLEWHQGNLKSKNAEIEWLRNSLGPLEKEAAELEWLRETLVAYEGEATLLSNQDRIARKKLDQLGREIIEMRATIAEQDQRLQEDLRNLRSVRKQTKELHDRLAEEEVDPSESDKEDASSALALRELSSLVERGNAHVDSLLSELEYRRAEMAAARKSIHHRISRSILSRTELGRRVADWHRGRGTWSNGESASEEDTR